MTVSRTLAQYLVNQGHGTGFADMLPDEPDDCFTVNEYPGRGPVWEHTSVLPGIERPSVQLVVRGKTVLETRLRAEAAHRRLIQISNQMIAGVAFQAVRHMQDGWMIARDDSQRFRMSRNYQVDKAPDPEPDNGDGDGDGDGDG